MGPGRVTERMPVAILGATGLVGQRMQQRLSGHPMFRVVAAVAGPATPPRHLGASEWYLEAGAPPDLSGVPLLPNDGQVVERLANHGARLALSALPTPAARDLEPKLVEAGIHVVSNAAAHRDTPGVPLVIADLNPHHLLPLRSRASEVAVHACATNCTVVPAALTLKPLWDLIGFSEVHVTSLQAISGAGRQALADGRFADNVVPWIDGEEEKVAMELRQVLGRMGPQGASAASFATRVACHRVAVPDGHTVRVHVRLDRPVELDEVEEYIDAYASRPQALELPSAPAAPLIRVPGPDRPQPRLDVWAGATTSPPDPTTDRRAGMAVAVGGLTLLEPDLLRFTALAHNTVRGAAGGTVLLAELLHAEGFL